MTSLTLVQMLLRKSLVPQTGGSMVVPDNIIVSQLIQFGSGGPGLDEGANVIHHGCIEASSESHQIAFEIVEQ